ncbi:MAG: DUF1592 domain-containing protein [Proteobacteria bacterium]|nr:MAG: DUF1592 domain-containing protein [Pseudomonadota bacterium]
MKISTKLVSLLVLASIGCNRSPSRPNLGQTQGAHADEEAGPAEGVVLGPDGKPIPATGKLTVSLAKQQLTTTFPRLSHLQWENSVKDLLQLPELPGLSKNFGNDPESLFGNNGGSLQVSPEHWTAYRNAAESLGDKVGKDALLYKKLIPANTNNSKGIVADFLRKAFRRPATEAEITQVVALYDNGSKLTGIADATGAGFSALISFTLQSPNFLYRIEIGDKVEGRYIHLTPHEVAARLSYAVWNSIPDSKLNELADSGKLLEPAVLKGQAERLLSDARGADLLKWVHVKGYSIDKFTTIAVDKKLFPESTQFDSESLINESALFVEDVIVTQGKGVTELFTAPYAFASAKTAGAYDISVMGNEPKKVDLDATQRAGLLSQASFLSHFSKSVGIPAIIKRGHYVAEDVLCSTFQGAPPVTENTDMKNFKTDRERVQALSGISGCGACHNTRINPPGFALDNFGPAGKWRTAESNGNAIDATGTYTFASDTISFDGPVELAKEIVKRPELHQCYARKLVEALYGRTPDEGDSKLIEKLGQASLQDLSAKELFVYILSDPLITLRSVQ